MRIVAADDFEVSRHVLRRILGIEHDVLGIVENGQQAVDLCEKERPDAVILDVSMPVLNGLEAAKQIRARGLATYIILATSLGNNDVRVVAKEVGAAQVVKPFKSEQLLKAIAALESSHGDDLRGA